MNSIYRTEICNVEWRYANVDADGWLIPTELIPCNQFYQLLFLNEGDQLLDHFKRPGLFSLLHILYFAVINYRPFLSDYSINDWNVGQNILLLK